jgi:hypothetical protein
LLAKALVPLAILFILSGCGGYGGPTDTRSREVRGRGFTVHVPAGWAVDHVRGGIGARKGGALVSVTAFPLQKSYDPAKFSAAARELDGVAAKLAARAGKTLSERSTTTVSGRKIRAYRYDGVRIGFVLDGKREYQLLCMAPEGGDPDDSCRLLFESFTVT